MSRMLCLRWTTATSYQQSTCPPRFIKLPRCLRRSPEWLISFAPKCRQNLWSKDPESAPGGSHRVMCLGSPVSHCLGQSTIITSLRSPWFSSPLAMHYSLKRARITTAGRRKVSDGAIKPSQPATHLLCFLEDALHPQRLPYCQPFSCLTGNPGKRCGVWWKWERFPSDNPKYKGTRCTQPVRLAPSQSSCRTV